MLGYTNIKLDIFNTASINSAIQLLEMKKKQIEHAKQEMLKYLAYYAVEYLRNEYKTLPIDVYAEPIENGYQIIASGDLAIITEFGIGVQNDKEQQPGGSGSAFYVPEPTITGLDELNIVRNPWMRHGSGIQQKKKQKDEEDDEAEELLAMAYMAMYRTAKAVEAEIPHAAKMFFS